MPPRRVTRSRKGLEGNNSIEEEEEEEDSFRLTPRVPLCCDTLRKQHNTVPVSIRTVACISRGSQSSRCARDSVQKKYHINTSLFSLSLFSVSHHQCTHGASTTQQQQKQQQQAAAAALSSSSRSSSINSSSTAAVARCIASPVK